MGSNVGACGSLSVLELEPRLRDRLQSLLQPVIWCVGCTPLGLYDRVLCFMTQVWTGRVLGMAGNAFEAQENRRELLTSGNCTDRSLLS